MTLVSDARAIANAGVRAADPARAVRRLARRYRGGIRVGRVSLVPDPGGRVLVLGLGKAAGAMADAAAALTGPNVVGLVAVPRGYPAPRSGIEVVRGEHPVPGSGSLRAGHALLKAVREATPADRILFVISGGGSAVADAPSPPVGLADLARTTEVLLGSAAPIQAMNAVRRHLSAFKGGQLAPSHLPGRFATIAISDVVGDRPEDVASGPTVPDPTTYRDALDAVARYRLGGRLPARVIAHLRAGAEGHRPETPKPSDPRFHGTFYGFGATNRTAVKAAAEAARRRGYAVRTVVAPVTGETRRAALRFASGLPGRSPRRPLALVAGGETTVTLGPHPGRGGRNQEFALAAAPRVAGADPRLVLSIGTDGIDGPTDAAGGWVDQHSVARARALGVDLRAALRTHSTYEALEALGSLVRTGPTGTNVTDLHVALARRQSGYGRK